MAKFFEGKVWSFLTPPPTHLDFRTKKNRLISSWTWNYGLVQTFAGFLIGPFLLPGKGVLKVRKYLHEKVWI